MCNERQLVENTQLKKLNEPRHGSFPETWIFDDIENFDPKYTIYIRILFW